MPLNLKQLRSDVARVTFPYADDEVRVDYKPSLFTPAYVADLAAREADAKDFAGRVAFLVGALCGLIESWDVLDEEGGKPLPITPDVLRGLELAFLSAAYQAVMGDVALGKRTGAKP